MKGNFSVNKDFDNFNRQRDSDKTFWLLLKPYVPINEENVIIKNLKLGDVITDTDGAELKVVEFGGAGLFGKDSFSWMWIKFEVLNGNVISE